MQELRRAGFTFVRLPVQPEVLTAPGVLDALSDSLTRLQRHGLGVVVSLHPTDWHLETSAEDREKMFAAWRSLAPVLRPFDPHLVFVEALNEPVFPNDPPEWTRLQSQILADMRARLPSHTIILTGNDWSSIDGLLATTPAADPNVIYTFHLYDPQELTALAAYRPGLDRSALARLPFPTSDDDACEAAAAHTADPPTAALVRFYCEQHWNVTKLVARVDAAAEWAQRNHVALLAGEFGASQQLNGPARLAWLAAVRAACERRAIGWALWGYDGSMGFALPAPPGIRHFDPDVLQALGLTPGPGRQ